MASSTEDIKARLDIVEFIRGYVRLDKAGINFKANCPFHGEKTPSFFVSPARQIWHCFGGCGTGGDIFSFAMKIEGLGFPEALRLLAARAGVEITREDPHIRSERNRLYDVCEAAARFFERSLLTTAEPKAYLRSRGMTEETVRAFRIGWAPDSWQWIVQSLAAKGFAGEDAERAGLAIRSTDGRLHDRFRSRIIFPITDTNARVIGFGGRIFQPQTYADKDADIRGQDEIQRESALSQRESAAAPAAKYINTPQTLIYDKSRALYGFDKAKQAIRQKNQAVVTEGYMDCAMSHQAGVAHTVAVSGTALTAPQMTALRRLCDTMICSFDADAAGESATRRSLSLAAQHGFTRKIAVIPSGKDPADTVREDPDAWRHAVDAAQPVVAFYFDKAFGAERPDTAEGKKGISVILLPLIAELTDEIEKAHWIAELARRLSVAEEAAWRALRAYGAPAVSEPPAEALNISKTRRELLEERFLAALALAPDEVKRRERAGRTISFSSALSGKLFEALIAPVGVEAAPDLTPHLERLRFMGEVLKERVPDIERECAVAGRELEKMCIDERRRELEREIGRRAAGADDPAHDLLLRELKILSDQRQAIT